MRVVNLRASILKLTINIGHQIIKELPCDCCIERTCKLHRYVVVNQTAVLACVLYFPVALERLENVRVGRARADRPLLVQTVNLYRNQWVLVTNFTHVAEIYNLEPDISLSVETSCDLAILDFFKL